MATTRTYEVLLASQPFPDKEDIRLDLIDFGLDPDLLAVLDLKSVEVVSHDGTEVRVEATWEGTQANCDALAKAYADLEAREMGEGE